MPDGAKAALLIDVERRSEAQLRDFDADSREPRQNERDGERRRAERSGRKRHMTCGQAHGVEHHGTRGEDARTQPVTAS